MQRFLTLVLFLLAALGVDARARADQTSEPAPAGAAADTSAAEFGEALKAIEDGAFNDAIDRLELLADRGFVHPDASFNRGVAYLGRARSTQRQAGDLGRAAAALAEALALRPNDPEAESTLDAVRSEIARARARGGGAGLVARPRLVRAIVGLAPEPVWGVLAALGSFVLAWGLVLRLLYKRPGTAVPGALSIGIGLLVFGVSGALAAGARHFRRSSALAVVVVPEARLLDESGRPLPQAAESSVAPEGAEVYVLEHRGGLTRVEWGNTDAWVVAGQVRELAKP
jgi:hypothetical protein